MPPHSHSESDAEAKELEQISGLLGSKATGTEVLEPGKPFLALAVLVRNDEPLEFQLIDHDLDVQNLKFIERLY